MTVPQGRTNGLPSVGILETAPFWRSGPEATTAGRQFTRAESSAFGVPSCRLASTTKGEAQVTRLPNPEDVRLPFEVDYAKVIESYTR